MIHRQSIFSDGVRMGNARHYLASLLKISVVLASLPYCSDSQYATSEQIDPGQLDFIQFVEEVEFCAHLDTAVVTYENGEGCRVELIADEDAIPRPGEGDDNFLSRLQNGLCQGLNLAFQLETIDYTPSNFIHADLTPEKFARHFHERESRPWASSSRFCGRCSRPSRKGWGNISPARRLSKCSAAKTAQCG